MAKRITYNDLKLLVDNLGYILISKEYKKAISEITIKDKDGFYYITNYNRLQQNKMPERFNKCNKFSIYNIQNALHYKDQKYTLVSKEYKSSAQKLTFKDENGFYYTNTIEQIMRNDVFARYSCSNKYTLQNIKLWLKINNINLSLISKKYIDAHKNLIFKDEKGYYYTACWNKLQQDHYPNKFDKSNNYTIQNIKLWCKLNKKPFKLLSNKYIDSTFNKLKWKCLKENCGQIFFAPWYSIKNGVGCGVCEGRQVTLSNCLATKNPKIAKEWHPTKNGNLTPYDVSENSNKKVWWRCSKNITHEWKIKINARKYNGCPYCAGQIASKEYNLKISNPDLCQEWNYDKNIKSPLEYTPMSGAKVWWKCKECGHEWQAIICDRNGKNQTGCPECFKSKGEQKIKNYLDKYLIIYDREFIFEDLKSDRDNPLRFDFAIFEDKYKNKLKYLIEYDGEFHYKKYYDEQNFEIQQKHDKRKTNYAKEHNIKLIRIPYWDFNNIEKILDKLRLEEV